MTLAWAPDRRPNLTSGSGLRRVAGWGRCLLLTLIVASASACGAPEKGRARSEVAITFAILPAEGQDAAQAPWTPLLNDLAQSVGVPVTPYLGSSYDDLAAAMKSGRAQVGWFAAQPAVQAIDAGDAELVARTMSAGGLDSYRSVLIVRKGSGLTLDDVLTCGQRYTFGTGDEQSTTGRLAPAAFLFNPRGIDPVRCFSHVKEQDHQANAQDVAYGIVDVATTNNVALATLAQRNAAMADQIEVIWRSPDIPGGAILAATDLDPAIREKIRSFFLTYGQGEGPVAERQRAVLAGLNYSRFGSAEADYFDPIREMMADQALEQARQSGDRGAAAQAERDLRRLRAAREVQP